MASTTITLYLDVVFFIYGLSFILLGIVVVTRAKEESRLELAHFIWLLAAFAFIHGVLEWMGLWEIVRGYNHTLALAKPCLLFVSYVFLFDFGRRMLWASLEPEKLSWLSGLVFSRALLAVIVYAVLLAIGFADEKKLALAIWSRYLLGFTGSLLTGVGFLLYCQNRIRLVLVPSDFRPIRHACQVAAFTFFVYGVLAGLVVPRALWFPADWLNNETFHAFIGLPVELFRAGCGILMLLSIAQLLWVFHIESHQRLLQSFTERKQTQDDLDAQNKTLNAITSSTQNAIVMIDDEGRISFWNQGAEMMFGYSTDEAMGQNLHELIAPERFLPSHRGAFPIWQKTGRGNAVGKTLELVGVRKGGQEFPIELSLSSVFLRQRWFAVGIIRDITSRKQQEVELSQAKLAAETANRAKSEFLANMSHEIRTPMNAILGLIQLVLETPLKPKQYDFLRKAHASSRALLSILNDILDYSKIEAGRLEIERLPFRIEETLKSVADLHTASITEKGLEIFLEIDPAIPVEVIGDAMRLSQVFNNLVGNAVKFTEFGEIHIKAEVAHDDGETVTLRFAVRDTGIGLSKKQMDRLFQAFTQGDGSITRKHGGTGLGLTISQRLIGLMGGSISVSSTEGEGSTFAFTIQVGVGASSVGYRDLRPLENCKILAVDDQETARIILKQILDAWGLETHTAASGEDALAQIEAAELSRCPFDAVLLDWRMPGMGGLEVARCLQDDARLGQLAHPLLVVMITAYDKEELLSQVGSIHLDGVLTKPVMPSELFNALVKGSNPKPVVSSIDYKPIDYKPTHNHHDFDGARILLVEDNAINQQVAAEFLSRFNLKVTLANHGGEAVDWVSRESFDAVLMDLHMPTMDGLEATRRILELQNGRDLPIIAMTAAVMPEDRERCAACGMVDFVSKPIDPDDLCLVLQRWIKPGSEGTLVTDNEKKSPPTPRLQRGGQENPSEVDLPDFLPGFDLGTALKRLCGNRQLLARLLLDFAEGQASFLAQLDAMLDEGDNAQATLLLHTLKGVASNLGASELARWAQQLEREVKADQPLISRIPFAVALTDATGAISTQVRLNQKDLTSERQDLKALAELLTSMAPYLREQELIPDAQMIALQTFAQNDLPDSPLAKLIYQINQFDHAGAMATITKLVTTLGLEL